MLVVATLMNDVMYHASCSDWIYQLHLMIISYIGWVTSVLTFKFSSHIKRAIYSLYNYDTIFTLKASVICKKFLAICKLWYVDNLYRRPYGMEQEYFVQLFVEYDETLKFPTVGDLLSIMYKEQKISFAKVLFTTNFNQEGYYPSLHIVMCII